MFSAAKLIRNWLIWWYCLCSCSIDTIRAAEGSEPGGSAMQIQPNNSRIVVLARYHEDASWIHSTPDNVPHIVYNSGDPYAEHQPPINKGKESMSYLTFIIDNYDALPKSMLFLHGHRRGWHDKLAPSDWVVRYLKWPENPEFTYVAVQCPEAKDTDRPWAHPANPSLDWSLHPRHIKDRLRSRQFAEAWPILFEKYFGPVPEVVSAPCCSEFLVSREAVLKLPKEFYENVREWIITTEWDSYSAALLLEYSWHIMWTPNHQAVYKNVPDCKCYLYGLGCPDQAFDVVKLKHMKSVHLPLKQGVKNEITVAVVLCVGLVALAASAYCHYCHGVYIPHIIGSFFTFRGYRHVYRKPASKP